MFFRYGSVLPSVGQAPPSGDQSPHVSWVVDADRQDPDDTDGS